MSAGSPAARRVGWVNLFPDDLTGTVHASGVFDSEDQALRAAGATCVATIKVEWAESPTERAAA